jgi:hypothetical protein
MLWHVASLRFGNVFFIAYPQDHEPRHVHGFTGETEVIVDLGIDGYVDMSPSPIAPTAFARAMQSPAMCARYCGQRRNILTS